MKQRYNLNWLLTEVDKKGTIKYLFFWGHQNKSRNVIGKSCFSQWIELPFVDDGVTYKTSEHWMMANKALMFQDIKASKNHFGG